jgi:hypothetical protein
MPVWMPMPPDLNWGCKMNSIASIHSLINDKAVVVRDVGVCVKSWGRRGIFWGGLFGFVLSAILVAIPFTSDALTFGTIGTLLVGAVECAVIAGGFGATVAAFFGPGSLRESTAGFERAFHASRRIADANWREDCAPLATWPSRWSFPSSTPEVTSQSSAHGSNRGIKMSAFVRRPKP